MTSIVFPQVTPPDNAARDAMREQWTRRRRIHSSSTATVNPGDGLGSIALWLAGCMPAKDAHADAGLENVRHIVVAGDHPVGEAIPEISHVSAGQAGLDESLELTADDVHVESLWVDAQRHAPQAHPADRGDALTEEEFDSAVRAGMDLADAQADSGVSLLLVGDHGRGLTSTAAVVVGSLCTVEPVRVVGRGSGIDDSAWRQKVTYIRDAMYRVRDDRAAAQRVLRKAGSADLAVLVGLLAQAAVRRTPVVFDGAGVAAAALVAHAMVPGASEWWAAASAGTEPATREALAYLDLTPLLDLSLDTDQGTCALLALPIIRHAWRTVPRVTD
ncbi:nicotinate-nucleotide--dimethylbenzimidazole phosphoribosyltransferase [Corynebacterium zhongnanshanii]|uniref:Nicotinate-nucleotide--dimethylbenzimidazole phosphoribosyltransferase n=1 Tax=Corynebacterium zhongnanshanii TaxID=2768834 RepID=A0ABQ6VDB6_9CORY|nr:nicotinate-nucleotide--dimethylbenzimidazole phosphoribosyltransferase [Corynebacterium zhongnanshanii]KAB3520848.1 nicotinate-nucleotide--dimethylbenzimidazole phosphoribosyltransferase [Corynebacterium zhongnanshanii]